jgi:hypothetical protein
MRPLVLASCNGHPDTVQRLLEAGAMMEMGDDVSYVACTVMSFLPVQ